jgi:hypothetical protein
MRNITICAEGLKINTIFSVIYINDAASKFPFYDTLNSIEPEVALRGVKQYNSILDAGANLVLFHHIPNLFVMGHSTGNVSAGIGLSYKNILHIEGSYLSQASGLRNYTNGSYEVDVSFRPFRKK